MVSASLAAFGLVCLSGLFGAEAPPPGSGERGDPRPSLEGREPETTPSLREPLNFPKRFAWSFETVDSNGRDVFAEEEVAVFKGDRPTHPDWIQEFGLDADPAHRDRYPRDPVATFSSREARQGRRSLHLLSRGDWVLVRLSWPVPVVSGITVRLAAFAKTQGLREGSLRLRVLFSGQNLPDAQKTLESGRLRGGKAWESLELKGQVPRGAEFLRIDILLEGSYRDGEAEAWVDALEMELMPGLRIDWGDRDLLLFGPGDEEIPFSLEACGMSPGGYRLEVDLERLALDGKTPLGAPLFFTANRFVSSASRTSAAAESVFAAGEARAFGQEETAADREEGPLASATEEPALTSLRFSGDLRQMFRQPGLPSGILRMGCRIRERLAPARPGEEGPLGEVLVEAEDRLGLLPFPAEPIVPKGLRLGISWTQPQIDSGELAVMASLPKGFPLADLLWDLSAVKILADPPRLPPEIRLIGERIALPWSGRFGVDFLRSPAAVQWLLNWSSHIRSWEAVVGPEEPAMLDLHRAIREGKNFVSLGASADLGRPSWARFLVFGPRAGSVEDTAGPRGPVGGLESSGLQPESWDWAILDAPRAGSPRERATVFSRSLLELAASGYRHLFVPRAFDLLAEPPAGGHRSPLPAAFAWVGLGRLLAAGPAQRAGDWDPRGIFLIVPDGTGQSIVAMARGEETFELPVWTGLPLEGRDLFGDPFDAAFDEFSCESRIRVGMEPVIYRGFDAGLVATVRSLAAVETELQPQIRSQRLRFSVRNRCHDPLSMGLSVLLPEGWGVDGGRGLRSLDPGAEAVFDVSLEAPQDYQTGKVKAALRLDLEHQGHRCFFRTERILEPRSGLIRISGESIDGESRRLSFSVENLAGRTLPVRLFCRVIIGGEEDLLESWDDRIPPQSSRRFAFDLDRSAGMLEGKEVRIGAEVRGQGESLGGRYRLKSAGGRMGIVPE